MNDMREWFPVLLSNLWVMTAFTAEPTLFKVCSLGLATLWLVVLLKQRYPL